MSNLLDLNDLESSEINRRISLGFINPVDLETANKILTERNETIFRQLEDDEKRMIGSLKQKPIILILFSFKGRISRLQYVLSKIFIILLMLIIQYIDGLFHSNPDVSEGALLVIVLLFWPFFAITTKRWHDRDSTGWLSVLSFIPLLFLWPLIELPFIKGTEGENKFGKDPLITFDYFQKNSGQTPIVMNNE